MEQAIFYREWLPLPKEEFNILMMLADMGGSFSGNLSDMCGYFHVNTSSKNKAPLKRGMLERIAAHYVGVKTGSERKYRLFAEA